MHGSINVKSPNNISKWQMGFNSAFKVLIFRYVQISRQEHLASLRDNHITESHRTQKPPTIARGVSAVHEHTSAFFWRIPQMLLIKKKKKKKKIITKSHKRGGK
jgi:hypothetical protein